MKPVTVTAHDPTTGETGVQVLEPGGYVLVVGERMELTSVQRSLNGTVQLTIKRKAATT